MYSNLLKIDAFSTNFTDLVRLIYFDPKFQQLFINDNNGREPIICCSTIHLLFSIALTLVI